MVRGGDRLGFMNELDSGPIAHEFEPSGLDVLFYSLDNTSYPDVGAEITFDPLNLPYLFAIDAVYDTGVYMEHPKIGPNTFNV